MKPASVLMLFSRIARPRDSEVSHARKSLTGAILCIAVSLIPLVVVLTVSDGMIEGITERIIGLSSFHIQAIQTRSYLDASQNLQTLEAVAADIASDERVVNTFIERDGTVLAAGKKGRCGAAIRAVDESLFTQSRAFSKYLNVIEGSASFPTEKSAVIGKVIAENLGISAGDTIRLISARTLSGGKTVPKISSFTVSGIVSSGYQEIDALWVFVPLKTGFNLLSTVASQVFIGIEVEDPFSASLESIRFDIEEKLPAGFYNATWKELNEAQYENFSSTKIMLLFVMFLIVLVAAVNVSSALIMIVMERRKETAVLKSLGASPSGIGCAYLLTGAFAGVSGVVLGLPAGLVCSIFINEIVHFTEKIINAARKIVYIIGAGDNYIPVHLLDPAYYLETIPVTIGFKELFLIALMTVFLSVLASIVPALKASREKPLSILRKV